VSTYAEQLAPHRAQAMSTRVTIIKWLCCISGIT